MSFNQIPANKNFLNPTNFQLAINRLPGVTFFCQRVVMPNLHLEDIKTPNPFNALNWSASSTEYGRLVVDFMVDEDFVNYTEIFNWMTGLGFPEDFRQYKNLKYNAEGNVGLRSDMSLISQTSSKNANIEWIFRECFPIFLGNFSMETTNRSAEYVTSQAIFSIRDFVPHVVNQPLDTGPYES